MTEPEQWAEELYVRVHNLTGVEAIALIQRAFDERERTGQLVPAQPSVKITERQSETLHKALIASFSEFVEPIALAQPSGDVVEAVARAICEASGDVWRTGEGMRSPFAAQADRVNNHWRFKATAAITAYEAASGVAKMREALRAFHDGALSRSETIARIDAALGEQP